MRLKIGGTLYMSRSAVRSDLPRPTPPLTYQRDVKHS